MWTPDESFQIRLTFAAKTLLAVGRAAVFAVFAVAAVIGVTGLLTTGPAAGLRPVLLAILIPVTGLVLAYAALPRFRQWVLGLDVRMLTLFQAWLDPDFDPLGASLDHMRVVVAGLRQPSDLED